MLHSRKFAGILYLSQGWKLKMGGALVDLEGGTESVPSFNTFVLFRVPRMHFVAPVLAPARPRLSVFGWWLEVGKLYEVDYAGAKDDEQELGGPTLPMPRPSVPESVAARARKWRGGRDYKSEGRAGGLGGQIKKSRQPKKGKFKGRA